MSERASWMTDGIDEDGEVVYHGQIVDADLNPVWICTHHHRMRLGALSCAERRQRSRQTCEGSCEYCGPREAR